MPQTKHQRSASDFVIAIENVVIDARFDWHSISKGQYSAADIMERWRSLARFLSETEAKFFPDGLPAKNARQRLAEADAKT